MEYLEFLKFSEFLKLKVPEYLEFLQVPEILKVPEYPEFLNAPEFLKACKASTGHRVKRAAWECPLWATPND